MAASKMYGSRTRRWAANTAFQLSASFAAASKSAPPQPSILGCHCCPRSSRRPIIKFTRHADRHHSSISCRSLLYSSVQAHLIASPLSRTIPSPKLFPTITIPIIINKSATYFESLPSLFVSTRRFAPMTIGAVEMEEGVAAEAKIPKEARRLLHGLAAGWGDVADSRALEVVPLKGAMTNEVFEIKWRGEAARKVVVRIYGEGVDVFFNRDDEIRTFECMSRHGQGPRLLGRFPTGRLEEFIHARTLSAVDMHDPEISSLIASKLREFHELDMPGPSNVILWDRLRNWLKAARSLCSGGEADEFCLDSMEEEITSLENLLSKEDQKIGFCHNDLQYGNIMMDEESRIVTIIDYEYSGFNPIAFDIANHFCEMAADYHTETPHVLDYNKYPDYEERKRFVHNYLSSSGEKPDDEEAENLLQDIEKYALSSHLVWGLWGIISEHVNEIDFDYMEYARQRFKQYWLMKPQTLGS